MNSSTDISLIEKHFEGELNEQERQEFDRKLEADPAFHSLYHQEKVLIDGIIASGKKTMRRRLQQLEQSLPEVKHERGKIRRLNSILWAAASFLVLFTIGALSYYYIFSSSSSEKLYAEYYEPYPNVYSVIQRSDDPVNLDELDKAFLAYEKSNYEEAVELFKLVTAKHDTPLISFYLANSYLAAEMFDEAIETYKKLLTEAESFEHQVQWYISLAYLKKGDLEETKKHLMKLTHVENTYKKRALALLKEL